MSKELIEALDRTRSLLLELSRLDYTPKEKARFNADAALLQAHRDAIAAEPVATVTDEMVSRFLGWPLPKDFAPDAGISFDRTSMDKYGWPMPCGTNLLNAIQARAMLEHVVQAQTPAPAIDAARPADGGVTDLSLIADMLVHYASLVSEQHSSRFEEFHYVPAIEEQIAALKARGA